LGAQGNTIAIIGKCGDGAMSDPEKPPISGGTSIDAEDNVNIGGDVVGRDKIETYQYFQQAPSADQGRVTLHEAGCLARTLLILGVILIVGGFLGFIGLAMYDASLMASPSQQSVEQSFAVGRISLVLLAWSSSG
jgi:hypothetical protein